LNIKCMFWFSLQLLFETFLIVRRIHQDIIKIVPKSFCEAHVILARY
jgi:hypothetical protein